MNTPDEVFRNMERRRLQVTQKTHEPPPEIHRVETVYMPQNVRAGSYRQLMQSHDRMGTRHLG